MKSKELKDASINVIYRGKERITQVSAKHRSIYPSKSILSWHSSSRAIKIFLEIFLLHLSDKMAPVSSDGPVFDALLSLDSLYNCPSDWWPCPTSSIKINLYSASTRAFGTTEKLMYLKYMLGNLGGSWWKCACHQSTQDLGHILSLIELKSDGHPALLHPWQWHHFILHFINQGQADLPVNRANTAAPTSEAVVEGRVLVACCQVFQDESKLQSNIQGLLQEGVLLLDD